MRLTFAVAQATWYNQQMKKLREEKKIACGHATDSQCSIPMGSSKDKEHLVRMGYFNMVNGYKDPFSQEKDETGRHIYFLGTTLEQIYNLKKFDEKLRLFLLGYITQIEEEIRTLSGYKFDQCNDNGKISWYDIGAYDVDVSLQKRMDAISSAYSELNRSRQEYVRFYMEQHESIPTWIMIKVVNFSTFIKIVQNSKIQVTHSLCELYDITDDNGMPNVKLLIGSLQWMRMIRNACAHNERVYCMKQSNNKDKKVTGRITEKYFRAMRKPYLKTESKLIMDLLVYFKYYLPDPEFKSLIKELRKMMTDLERQIPKNAFDRIRGRMGIKKLEDLDALANLEKKKICYNSLGMYHIQSRKYRAA